MELTTTHKIYYSNKRHIPLAEMAESLIALEGIIKQSPNVLENLFPGTKIQGIEIYLSELRSGSLYEDVVIKFIFGSQEKFDEFITNIRERTGLDNLKSNNQLLSVIIVTMALTGGSYYLGKSNNTEAAENNVIENNINIVINNGAKMIQMEPDEFRSVIEDSITDKDKLAKDSIKFIKPAKRDTGADITFDEDPDISVSNDSVQAMPRFLTEPEPEEAIEDFDKIEVVIRATDLDSNRRGWAAIIPSISNKRVKLQLDPHINSEDLMQHPTLLGSVTVIFKYDDNGNKIPSLYFLREIYEFIEENR